MSIGVLTVVLKTAGSPTTIVYCLSQRLHQCPTECCVTAQLWNVQLVLDANESAMRKFKEQPDVEVYEIKVF